MLDATANTLAVPSHAGDYGILVSAGTGQLRALLLNAFSMVPAFLGVITGIEAGTQANNWILAFTAGMFLYIALGSMVCSHHDVAVKRQCTAIQTALHSSLCWLFGNAILNDIESAPFEFALRAVEWDPKDIRSGIPFSAAPAIKRRHAILQGPPQAVACRTTRGFHCWLDVYDGNIHR